VRTDTGRLRGFLSPHPGVIFADAFPAIYDSFKSANLSCKKVRKVLLAAPHGQESRRPAQGHTASSWVSGHGPALERNLRDSEIGKKTCERCFQTFQGCCFPAWKRGL